MPFDIVLVDDHKLVRDGVKGILERGAEFRVVGEAENGADAVQLCKKAEPDLVLMDIGLPGLSGIEGVRILQERHPSIAPVMLTVFKDDDRIFQAICAGACGYLLKQTPPGRLMEAVKQIAEGGAVMSPEVAMRVVELFRQAPPREAGSAGLSPQEMRLLKLLTEGHHTKTAAAELGISVHTVTFHLRSIYEKLHVHSRSEAVARALRDGLVH